MPLEPTGPLSSLIAAAVPNVACMIVAMPRITTGDILNRPVIYTTDGGRSGFSSMYMRKAMARAIAMPNIVDRTFRYEFRRSSDAELTMAKRRIDCNGRGQQSSDPCQWRIRHTSQRIFEVKCYIRLATAAALFIPGLSNCNGRRYLLLC